MSKTTTEQALAVAAEGFKDLNDYVQALQIPGFATLLAIGAFTIQQWEVRKFESLLDYLRTRLDLNREQLAEHIHEHRQERWMAEGLARGWKAMQETMDPTCRQCSELMVGDYLVAKRAPDRFHRQFTNLFMEADVYILKVIERISAAKMSLGCEYMFVSQSVRHPNKTNERFYEVQDGDKHYHLLEGFDEPRLLQAACDLLTRTGLMSQWFGHMEMPHARKGFGVYTVYGEVKHYLADTWTHLHGYLAPIRAAKPTT